MSVPETARVPLSRSQQNLYNGVLQDGSPALYLIGKSYRFHPLELSRFLAALNATLLENAVQLCVLEMSATGDGYPDLVPQLQFDDIVQVRSDQAPHSADELTRSWATSILGKPLVRYLVRTDGNGFVTGLDVHTHHILVDGGATAIIEADLARHLVAGPNTEVPCLTDGMAKLAEAHRREASKVDESLQRLADAAQRELADEARYGGHGRGPEDVPGMAAKGVLQESVTLAGNAFDAILALSEAKQIPLNVLVAAAAVAVDASLRQSTEGLLVHAVDNRFGDPALNVATCLVNSVAHAVRFAPFASVHDVVRMLDRGYVRAVRRRWLREEHYRRMYLAINRTSHIAALTLNFIRQACAPDLRPFLSETPVATDIGPVEGMTVASVLDEDQRTLNLAIWNRADLPERRTHRRVAERIAAALESMAARWDRPIAMTVDEWFGVAPDGARCHSDAATCTEPATPAWFMDATGGVHRILETRHNVSQWVAWLVQNGAAPGDVLVFTDDNTVRTTDLLIACHLAGCGYSVCDTPDEIALRVKAIADHGDGISARAIDVRAAALEEISSDEHRRLANERIALVTHDVSLATRTAYIMPTSGSTGQPKLVHVSHGSLALFCDAARQAYGWGPKDTILQCAPLTSDISVEEIFGGASCGSGLARTTGMKTGDLDGLTTDLVANRATVVDLPTAVWHLLCEDGDAMTAIRRSSLRQIVVGGEAIRPSAVDKWLDSGVSQAISLISTYGPTETTVVVTHLPIACNGEIVPGSARLRLGRPIVTNSVFIGFGEVVVVGDLVSTGYLGTDDRSFGIVTESDGSRRRAFATADRVTLDGDGFPVFSGRKDAIVKIAGKRVDIAEVTRRISEDPTVSDVAVELHNGSLGVWFETQRTREAGEDAAAASRIRLILVSAGVSSFFVVGVPNIPRKPNGKVDSDNLRTMPQFADTVLSDPGVGEKAAGLAEVWSRHLGRTIRPDSSLLGEGVGSLDLIRILPDTRGYLGRHLSILDLISADTAANLIDDASTAEAWMDPDTAAEIDGDLASLWSQRSRSEVSVNQRPGEAIVVLGASGILGTGFAQAVLDLERSGAPCPPVVLATRSILPEHNPWAELRNVDGVRIQRLSPEVGRDEVEALIRDSGAGTVVNCIGNTNVLVPYRELRPANVNLVAAIVDACANTAARLVHLSTFVVNADVTASRVTDPRDAPYPYAASKSLAELAVAGSPQGLDFTIARLPRVLGEDYQLHGSADILLSVVDACIALRAYPSLTLTEEVTTGRAVAHAILGQLTNSTLLGRGITVVRGEAVAYAELLSGYAIEELDVAEWKYRLDESDWAKGNPRRWSVVDAWLSLGMRLGGRSYAEYLADYPTIALGVEAVAELAAPPQSVLGLLAHSFPSVDFASTARKCE